MGSGTPRASHSSVTTVSSRAVTSVVKLPPLMEGGTGTTVHKQKNLVAAVFDHVRYVNIVIKIYTSKSRLCMHWLTA